MARLPARWSWGREGWKRGKKKYVCRHGLDLPAGRDDCGAGREVLGDGGGGDGGGESGKCERKEVELEVGKKWLWNLWCPRWLSSGFHRIWRRVEVGSEILVRLGGHPALRLAEGPDSLPRALNLQSKRQPDRAA